MSRLDEKRFKALGQEWIARFDFNATCAIEEETGKGFYEFVGPLLIQLDREDAKNPAKVFEAMKGIRQSDIRLVLLHALSGAHDVTAEEVGDIVQEIGMGEAMAIVGWCLVQAMPGRSGDGETEGNGSPTGSHRRRKAGAKPG